MIEWPEGEEAPTKYWCLNASSNIAFHQLVSTAKLRWRIDAIIRNSNRRLGSATSKGEARGFHHHATLCIAAYRYPISTGDNSPLKAFHQVVQRNYNSRSLPAQGVRHCGLNGTFEFDCHHSAEIERCSRGNAVALPLLRRDNLGSE